MAAITTAPTPLGLMSVAVVQASDLHQIGSLAMVISIINFITDLCDPFNINFRY